MNNLFYFKEFSPFLNHKLITISKTNQLIKIVGWTDFVIMLNDVFMRIIYTEWGWFFFSFFSNLYILLLELCEQPGKVTWPPVSSPWLESIQLPTISTFCILFFWCSAKCVQLLQMKIQTNQPSVTSIFWTENFIPMARTQPLEKRNSLEEELGKKDVKR